MSLKSALQLIVVASTFIIWGISLLSIPLIVGIIIWRWSWRVTLWPLLLCIAYCCWIFIDRHTSSRGGRYSEWVRRWTIWKLWVEYFPLQLIKTTDLDPNQNYIFGYHPHGIGANGALGNFATDATGFSQLFPGIRPHLTILPFQFFNPLMRELLLALGICSVSRSSCEYILNGNCGQGNALVIIIGGGREIKLAKKDPITLYLKSRKGFIRLALKHGASLVPVISFGENDLFEWYTLCRSIPMEIPWGRLFMGIMPRRHRVVTVVGKPISVVQVDDPTVDDIDQLHNRYVQAVEELFMEEKDKWGYSNSKLEII